MSTCSTWLNHAGPYFYLPKMQSHKEARLWNDVFIEAQDMLNIPRGTIKVPCAALHHTLYTSLSFNSACWLYAHHILLLVKRCIAGKLFVVLDCVLQALVTVLPVFISVSHNFSQYSLC